MTQYTPEDAEMEKRLGALKMMGIRDVVLDNVKASMDSATIESMLTGVETSFRILGRSEMVTIKNDGMLYVTGNGMRMSPDLRRRCLTVVIDSGLQATARARGDFNGFDPPDVALKTRPAIINAALAVLKAYEDSHGEKDLPQQRRDVSSFEEWGYIRDVLIWLGYPDLGTELEDNQDNDEGDGVDAKDSVLRWFTRAWQAKRAEDDHLTSAGLIASLADSSSSTVRDILLEQRSHRTAERGGIETMNAALLSSALKKLGVLNATWPLELDGRIDTVRVLKTGPKYTVVLDPAPGTRVA